MTEQDALLILNALPGLSNKRIFALVTHFGGARAVLEQDVEVWGCSATAQDLIRRFDRSRFLEEEQERIDKEDVSVITYFDPFYPHFLKEIPDAPLVLYVKGRLPAMEQAISVVGSRRASLYGLDIARKFGMELSWRDIPVVSGCARGIDTAAHKGVLEADGQTIAVLGSGLSRIYPAENEPLVERICERGAVLSEFSMTMEPFAYNFPRRNRIVSGLSRGVMVVEAALKSGALITADLALEQGREVYCVPGPVDSPASRGVHHLIQQGAKLITSVEDIFEDTGGTISSKESFREQDCLSKEETELLNKLSKTPRHLDELGEHAASVLLKLEMKHLVKQLPGKHYTKE